MQIQNSEPSATKLNSLQKPIAVSQPNLANVNLYNNPLQQYSIVINKMGLANCLASSNTNTNNINACILANIKGTNKIDDYNTNLVNLVPNNLNFMNSSNNALSQNDISVLQGTNLTAYDINTSNQFNNIKINLVGLQQAINTYGIDTAIVNNIYGFDSGSNQFKNINQVASNFTIDQSGKLIMTNSQQNFENLENNSCKLYNIILLLCVVLFIIIICK